MRFTRYTPFAMLIATMLLSVGSAPAGTKEDMEALQRDMADVQQKVQDLQKALLDPKTGSIYALQTSIQQAIDMANRTNSSVNNLNAGMMQTLQSALRGVNDQLSSVIGLSATVKSMSDDVSNLGSSFKDLQSTVNKQGQLLVDISNQMKLLQAQPAAPPPTDSASGMPGSSAPPPTAETLFENAVKDMNSGRLDMSLQGFKNFLHLYPNDPSAIAAQYNIGNIYYQQAKLGEAVAALDAGIEQYPVDEKITPGLYFMKGMALKQLKDRAGAILALRKVVTQFPKAPEYGQAKTELTTLNAGPAIGAKKPH